MYTIIVTRRSNDYHAQLEGERGCWGRGSTVDEAIGDLVRSWPELFDITIKQPEKEREE